MKKAISVAEALQAFDHIPAVEAKKILLGKAVGLRPVEDILFRRSLPATATAAQDGWASISGALTLANRRKPVPLPEISRKIDRGEPMPPDCDVVLDFNRVVLLKERPAAVKSVKSGSGVIVAGSLCREGDVFIPAGSPITGNAAILGAYCGIGHVLVRRPVVDIICNTRGITAENDQLIPLLSAAIRGAKATVGAIFYTRGDPKELAMLVQSSSADVIATLGGTGNGPGDSTLEGLAEVCDIHFHGVRMKPGGTVAFSMIGARPVFSLPGDMLDILAVNAVLTGPFARKVFDRPPRMVPPRQARLLSPLSGGKEGASLFFGKIREERIEIIGDTTIGPARMAAADSIVMVMEGDRHKRVGEYVSYLKI